LKACEILNITFTGGYAHFLTDRTNGRAYATVSVCRRRLSSVTYAFWLNGAS